MRDRLAAKTARCNSEKVALVLYFRKQVMSSPQFRYRSSPDSSSGTGATHAVFVGRRCDGRKFSVNPWCRHQFLELSWGWNFSPLS